MRSLHSKKLNDSGFHHAFVIGAAFVVLFGLIGTYFLLTSNAATTTDEISNGNGTCIEDPGNQGQGNTNLLAKPCNQSYRQIFEQDGSGGDNAWHTYKIFYNSSGPLCLSSQGNHTSPGTPLQANKCGTNDANALTLYLNSNNQMEVAKSNGICVDSASSIMFLANCGNAGTWHFRAKKPVSGGGSGGGSASALLNYAEGFAGVPYLRGGGHDGWAAFHNGCQTPSKNNPKCEVDCSGLVSMVVDAATHSNWDWTVGADAQMHGAGSGHWHAIPFNSVQTGDIVTTGFDGGHVEFVVSGHGANLITFGAHNSSVPDGVVSANGYHYTNAYRYE